MSLFTVNTCQNMHFKLSVRGGLPPQICSQIKKYLNLMSAFFKKIWNSKKSESSEGVGLVGPNWELFPIFFCIFFFTHSLTLFMCVNHDYYKCPTYINLSFHVTVFAKPKFYTITLNGSTKCSCQYFNAKLICATTFKLLFSVEFFPLW